MDKFRLIVAGGRDFIDPPFAEEKISYAMYDIVRTHGKMFRFVIISGGAKGADKIGELFALKHNFTLEVYPADWDTHGKSAGPIRNKQMADASDGLVAFWDGKSRGTKNMIDNIVKQQKFLYTFKY